MKTSKVVLIIVAVVFGLITLNYFANSYEKALETVSVGNIKDLSKKANESYQALKAKRDAVQLQQDILNEYTELYGTDFAAWPQGKRDEFQQQKRIVSQLITSYNADCAQYKALWQDEWRSVPAPNDLPTTCETW